MDVDHLGSSRSDAAWTYVLLAGGGAVALSLLPLLSALLGDLSFLPFQDLIERVGSMDGWLGWLLRPAIGLVVGAVAAAFVLDDEWRLEVGDDALVIVHRRDRRRVARAEVVGVHLDGRKVVVEGTAGRVLHEERNEAPRDRVLAAFRTRGYPLESE